MSLSRVSTNETPGKPKQGHQDQQEQKSELQGIKLSTNQQTPPTKTNIFKIAAVTAVILIITAITLLIVELSHARDTYTQYLSTTDQMEDRNIISTPYSYQHKTFVGQNTQTTGKILSLPKTNPQQNSVTPQIVVVNNNQSGISLKKINDNNYFIQVEPQKLIAYYQKTHPTEIKRMLAYLHITRTLTEQRHSFGSDQLRNKIVELICQKIKMNTTNTIFKEIDYHVATRTDQGFILHRQQPTSTRLLQSAPNRQLFFYDMYMAYLMAARTQQMVDVVEQIQKAQQKQQKKAGENKGQQPVTVVTVINIVNNSNVVINLNSSNNVVINNNNNKQVNIVKGNNQPVINNNTQNTNNSNNNAQTNTNNQIQNNNNQQIQNKKRMLTTEQTNQSEKKYTQSDDAVISKGVFEYAGLCSDVGQDKYCPVGYFHRDNNPFKLAAGQMQKGVGDLKKVRRIVIGSQLLVNIEQLAKRLADKN